MANKKVLLLIDAIINLIIGLVLILYPLGMGEIMGLPTATTSFYPSILGAVIFGIGIALYLERSRKTPDFVGLGIGGAIIINFCGGLALLFFLLFGNLNISLRGFVILWSLVAIVLITGLFELFFHVKYSRKME